MKKRWLKALTALVLTAALLAGCAAKNDAPAKESYYEGYYDDYDVQYGTAAGFTNAKAEMDVPMATADAAESYEYSTDVTAAGSNLVNELTYNENVKLIFRAWVRLQTQDFAQTERELNALVERYNGYFESVSTDNGTYYASRPYLRGSYTVRIPAENYDKFLAAAAETCHVVSCNKNTEDVGLSYSDTQMRLQTERTKQERLLSLLAKAEEMDDIIRLEGAISDCQYYIDRLTSTLNRYDSLVNYSTVEIELEQVERLDAPIGSDEETFAQRLAESFREGIEGFLGGLEDFVLWLASHLIGLAVFAAIIVLAVKLWKKFVAGKWRLPRRKSKKDDFPKDEANE